MIGYLKFCPAHLISLAPVGTCNCSLFLYFPQEFLFPVANNCHLLLSFNFFIVRFIGNLKLCPAHLISRFCTRNSLQITNFSHFFCGYSCFLLHTLVLCLVIRFFLIFFFYRIVDIMSHSSNSLFLVSEAICSKLHLLENPLLQLILLFLIHTMFSILCF